MDAADFLARYWQKQPCLIQHAFGDFQSFISKQDLFTLACRQEVESRLVMETGVDRPWQVTHGPFCEKDFLELPKSHWTLLVQNTDFHLPAAAAFLDEFRFIPNWRIDDLMISYAPELGSVGPHLDSYDVFLFQASGKRRWSINNHDYDEDDFIDGLDLRVIDNFQPVQDYILEAGDMLYLPPGIAHHGVTLTEGMTFSVGFRAPSSHELVSHYVDDLLASEIDLRYRDPGLCLPEHSGEISKEDLGKIATLLHAALPNDMKLAIWFGTFVTRLPENCEPEPLLKKLDTTSFLGEFRNKAKFEKKSACRTAFIDIKNHLVLFVNGEAYTLPVKLKEFVCIFTENNEFPNPLSAQDRPDSELVDLLCRLYNDGIIHGVVR